MTDSLTTFDSFSFSGKSFNCYGLAVVRDSLSVRGIKVSDTVDYASDKPILVSLYWPEQLFDFIKWRYDGRLRSRKIICGGNYPTTSPQAVLPFCDYVYLGDGELWDGNFDGDYIISKSTKLPKKRAISENILPIKFEDLQDTRRGFVEISRGCKNKCLFCQYGWLKPYRESNIVDLEAVIGLSRTKSIRVFAADRFQHSKYSKIRQILERIGKNDTGSDVSIRFLLKHPEYLKYTNKVRVGIEGMSYRLRRMIGKNYTDDDIVRFCDLVVKNGIKSFDWYMIYGLPSETDDDVEHFDKLLTMVDAIMPSGYALAIHWNAFSPSAQTPLQWCAPAHGEFKALQKLFDTRKNNLKIFHKPRLTSEWTIIKRMLAIRGDVSCAKLIFNIAKNQSLFARNKNFVFEEYNKATGRELFSEWNYNDKLPWDKFVIYKRDLMTRIYKNAFRTRSI